MFLMARVQACPALATALKKGKGPFLKGIQLPGEGMMLGRWKGITGTMDQELLMAFSRGMGPCPAQVSEAEAYHLEAIGQGRLLGGSRPRCEAWAVGRMWELGSGRTEVWR